MFRARAYVLLFVSIVSLAAIPGCRNDDVSVSPTSPTTHAPPADQSLVGSWYKVGSEEGIELTGNGTWFALSVFQNRLAPGYYDRDPVGSFDIPKEGVLVHTWTDAYGRTQSNTFSYILRNDESTLVLNPVRSETAEELTFVRTAIGDLVIQR